MRQAAARLVRAAGYVGAAAVEFLYDPASEDFWFLEANTRLEVEHGVSEITTGLDLVKLQVHVARGGRLPGEPPPASGHAIEVRLCAEDAEAGFAPAPGTVARLRLPGGPGLRVDAGVAEGDLVPAEFDSMIAKLIAHGRDREEALGRLVAGPRPDGGRSCAGARRTRRSCSTSSTAKRCAGAGSTWASSTASWLAGSRPRAATPSWRWCARPSRPTRPRRTPRRRASCPPPCAGGRRCGRRRRAPWSCGREARRTGSRCGARPWTATAWRRTAAGWT